MFKSIIHLCIYIAVRFIIQHKAMSSMYIKTSNKIKNCTKINMHLGMGKGWMLV